MVNFIRGFRLGRGTIKHSTTLYDEFKPKTQFELDSLQSGNTNFPNTTLSPMDSLRIQNSRNSLLDSVFHYSYYTGLSKGKIHRFGTGMRKSDSIRYMEKYQLDSMVIIEVYQKFENLKKKQ